VLGAEQRWAEANPQALEALLRALHRAAEWCADPANRNALATLMAGPAYLARPAEWMLPALSGALRLGGGERRVVEDFFIPLARAATFPWKSHALWFYSQMVRWGQVAHSAANAALARDTYRPDLYRAALKPLGVALPGANAKVEGALTGATPVGSAGTLDDPPR